MGKKKLRKSYHSKGIHSNVSKYHLAIADQAVTLLDRALMKISDWQKGKNPWITVENPNRSETAKRMIRVRANDYYGSWKRYNIFMKKNEE